MALDVYKRQPFRYFLAHEPLRWALYLTMITIIQMCIRDRAYCLGITKIDPIQYDLLFERFLNPDRISLPDIDVDFDCLLYTSGRIYKTRA